MIATQSFFLWRVRDRIIRGDPDFTIYYTAAKIVREGRAAQLYDARTQLSVQQEFTNDPEIRRSPLPFIHPAFEALLFLPLTFVSYPVAFLLWNLVSLAMLFYISVLLRSFAFLRAFAGWEVMLACLAFFPVFANFQQGQDAILLLLLCVLGFRALRNREDFIAGCWLGLGMFKFHLMLPLFVVFALWRGRRFIFGFVSVTLAAAIASVAVVGWQGTLRYPIYAWHVISQPGFGRIPARQLPNLLGLVMGWPFAENGGWVLQLLVLLCSAGLLIATVRLAPSRLVWWKMQDEDSLKLGFACAVIAALLVAYSTGTYDLSLLVLPLAIVADYCLREFPGRGPRKLALLVPIAPLLLSPLWFLVWMRWQRTNLMAIFLLFWTCAIRKEILRRRAAGETIAASFERAAQPASAGKTGSPSSVPPR